MRGFLFSGGKFYPMPLFVSAHISFLNSSLKLSMAKEFKNYIAGEWRASSTGKTFENHNPANWDEVLGTFPLSGEKDVDEAAKAALAAFKIWRLVPAPHRGDIIRRAGDIMVQRKDEIARLMTKEMGKPFAETKGDV